MRTYLYGIAIKLVYAERRRQNRVVAPADEAAWDLPDQALWVRQALDRLDPTEREILMLRDYEQLSYLEIAEVLGLQVNTVRSRLFRSRMALKGYLEPAGGVR